MCIERIDAELPHPHGTLRAIGDQPQRLTVQPFRIGRTDQQLLHALAIAGTEAKLAQQPLTEVNGPILGCGCGIDGVMHQTQQLRAVRNPGQAQRGLALLDHAAQTVGVAPAL